MLYHGVPVQLAGGGSWDAVPQALGVGLLGKQVPSLNLDKVPVGTAVERLEGAG